MGTNGLRNILDVSQFEFKGGFDEQVQMLLAAVRMNKDEVEDLVKLFYDIEEVLQNLWPGCIIMPFGSVISGLGIKTSDVDIYTEVPRNLMLSQKSCVKRAKNALSRKPHFQQLFGILTAKVPIIKFFHVPTGRHCDISFKSPAGVRNSNLIGFLIHMDPRVLPLTVLIKFWSKVHKLTGTNLMPTYTLIMMVIFYLQQKSILPPIHRLQQNCNKIIVDGWNTAFNKDYHHETINRDSLYKLFGDFFVYYSGFDFNKLVISPFAGSALPRSAFMTKLISEPNIFHCYNEQIVKDEIEPLKIDSCICVQDPFEHSRNCAVAVYPKLFKRIESYFKYAEETFLLSNEEQFLQEILMQAPPSSEIPVVVNVNTDSGQNSNSNQNVSTQQSVNQQTVNTTQTVNITQNVSNQERNQPKSKKNKKRNKLRNRVIKHNYNPHVPRRDFMRQAYYYYHNNYNPQRYFPPAPQFPPQQFYDFH